MLGDAGVSVPAGCDGDEDRRRLFIERLPARLHAVAPHGDRGKCNGNGVDSTTTEGVGLRTSGFLIGVALGALVAVVGWLVYRRGR